MLTICSRATARRGIIIVIGIGSLVLSGLAGIAPLATAKDKYKIDPVTGTKYKADPDMQELLISFAALAGKPIETLTPQDSPSNPLREES